MTILHGNFQLANPIIRIVTAFHVIKCLPDSRTVLDRNQWDNISRTYRTRLCLYKNELSQRNSIAQITVLHQIDINQTSLAISDQHILWSVVVVMVLWMEMHPHYWFFVRRIQMSDIMRGSGVFKVVILNRLLNKIRSWQRIKIPCRWLQWHIWYEIIN